MVAATMAGSRAAEGRAVATVDARAEVAMKEGVEEEVQVAALVVGVQEVKVAWKAESVVEEAHMEAEAMAVVRVAEGPAVETAEVLTDVAVAEQSAAAQMAVLETRTHSHSVDMHRLCMKPR